MKVPDAADFAQPSVFARSRESTRGHRPRHAAVGTLSRCVAAAMLVLACSAVAGADTFRILENNQQALQARIDLIQQAQHDIVLAHYAVDKGRVPAALLAVLRQAAQRGVRVRMIVDGLKSRFPTLLYPYLESQGIEVRSYHPLRLAHPLWLNHRIHVKLFVVDGQQMIVGSRNLQDEHFGINDHNFIDCDAYLSGASASHVRRYFDWLWQMDDVQPVRLLDSPTYGILGLRPLGDDAWTTAWRRAREPQDFHQLLMQSLAALVQCHGIRLNTGHDWSAGLSNEVPAVVWHDRYLDKRDRVVEKSVLDLIRTARSTVLIETGYPVLTRAARHAILAAQRRGVQVTLVTNSLASTDKVSTYAAHENTKRHLLQAGVEIWEYNGPETLHAKTMLIDGCTVMISSYNFDPRSAHLNLELAVVTHDRQVASDLRQTVVKHMSNARRIDPAPTASPLQGWVPSGGNSRTDGEKNRGTSAARQLKMQLYRLTMPTFRWLL